jgi:hypothetical protein
MNSDETILIIIINFGGNLDDMAWRNLKPVQLFKLVEMELSRRLN